MPVQCVTTAVRAHTSLCLLIRWVDNWFLVSREGHHYQGDLEKGEQSRWEDHEVTGENITKGELYRFIVFLFLLDSVGHLFYHCLTFYRPFRSIKDLKTYFKRQQLTLD